MQDCRSAALPSSAASMTPSPGTCSSTSYLERTVGTGARGCSGRMVEGRCRWLLVLSLLCGAARGFVLGPGGGARMSLQRASRELYGRRTTSICRMADEQGEGATGDDEAAGKPADSSGAETVSGQDNTNKRWKQDQSDVLDTAAPSGESDKSPEDSSIPVIPFVYKTNEELWKEFPDAPKAPTRPALNMNDFRQEDLISGNMEITYGGKPAARTAIEDYENIERERIHLSTAARVLNYEALAAERARNASTQGSKELPQQSRRDIHAWHPFPDYGPPALYKWDQNPQLITFTGFEVLYNYMEPIGLILRETLGAAWNWEQRLPGPDFFEDNFKTVYNATTVNLPMFGLVHNLTSQEWWFHVITDTYLRTVLQHDLEPELVFDKIDEIFDDLFFEIMVGPECYELMPDVGVVLNRLANWRDDSNGPKLAVLTNEDERTHLILENLGILPYFDFVLTSREMGVQKPYPEAFEKAMEIAGVTDPAKVIHIGYDYNVDIAGACEQGFEAACIKPKQSDWEAKDEPYQYHRLMQFEDLLDGFGLPTLKKKTMRRRRGQWWGDPEEDAKGWWGEETLGCNQL